MVILNVIKMVCRRASMWKCFGRRKNGVFFLFVLALVSGEMLVCWNLSTAVGRALLPPQLLDQGLDHYRRSRSLKDYLDDVRLLVEPSTLCKNLKRVSVIIMVASSPPNRERRDAIRRTWARKQPTVFIMGLSSNESYADGMLADNYMEAEQHGDTVVYDFRDHYQNLTLKTVLMLKWTLNRCPQAEYVFKTDDDVFVNPWTLKRVIIDHPSAHLIGYRFNGVWLRRDVYDKWYLPRWLFHEDYVTEYLSGSGYLIKGKYLRRIFRAAFKVPMLNLEDIYICYSIAKRYLGLNLAHDARLSPYRPWIPFGCSFWTLACSHSFKPQDVIDVWAVISYYSKLYKEDRFICYFYEHYLSKLQLYYV